MGYRRQLACLFCGALLLAAVGARAQSPLAVPVPTGLAILIIGDQSNPGMLNMERVLAQSVKRDQTRHGVADRALPIIYYHLNKATEKRYCDLKLGIHASDLLFAGVVEHQNFVVKSILYRERRIQVPETSAEALVSRAADFLKTALPPLPGLVMSATPWPTDTEQPPEVLRKSFGIYQTDMLAMLNREQELSRQTRDMSAQHHAGNLSDAQFLDLLQKQLLPAARDLYAGAQKMSLGSPEVVHLHQSYIEYAGYTVKADEALVDGLKGNQSVLLHLAENYSELGTSARGRWQLEREALARKYGL